MSWIIIAIFAYFLLAVVFLVDKYLLSGPILSSKIYAFYVGFLQIVVLALIPFIEFSIPSAFQLFLCLVAGVSYVLALIWFFKGLQKFEASRITPAVGGMIPVFSMVLVFVFSSALPSQSSLWALFFLVLGTIIIAYEKEKKITLESLKISAITALLWAVHFVVIKYVYLDQSFWQGFIWVKLGGVLTALFFLFSKEVRSNIFQKKERGNKKTAFIFFLNQGTGALANILQNWAIALAPLSLVALVPAFQGVQYVFLLVIVILLSFRFPKFLKEETSKKVVFQKLISVLLIGGGILLLSL